MPVQVRKPKVEVSTLTEILTFVIVLNGQGFAAQDGLKISNHFLKSAAPAGKEWFYNNFEKDAPSAYAGD